MRSSPPPSAAARYGAAIAACGIALLLWLALDRLASVSPFPLLLAAVALSAWYGGLGPGLLGTFLSTLVIDFFYEDPVYSLAITSPDTVVKLGVFVAAAVVISQLTERLRATSLQAARARAETESAHAQLLQTLERISDGFFALDRDGRFTYLNPQAVRILFPHDQLAQQAGGPDQPIWQELPAGSGKQWESVHRKAMAEQTMATFEDYYPALQRWIEFRVYPDTRGLSVFCRESRRSWSEPISS